jgi:hypothetical protein
MAELGGVVVKVILWEARHQFQSHAEVTTFIP